jgi:condensation enzyme
MPVMHQSSSQTASVSGIPFSCNQEFTYMFEEGEADGQFGPRNHLVHGWRLRGEVHTDTLRAALDDLVVRHEMLRTSIVLAGPSRYQEVLPPSSAELSIRDMPAAPGARDLLAEELLIEIESGTLDIQRLPHLRATAARFDTDDWFLVIQAHHTVTDGWSMRLIMRDLAELYAERRGYGNSPPQARQYSEYVAWQHQHLNTAKIEAVREYWRAKLLGARLLVLPTDRPASTDAPKLTSVHRHHIATDVITPARRLAAETRSTLFMVMLGALNVLLARMTGTPDIVMPTFTPGRDHELFENTIGPMFNFVPLRTNLAGCRAFRDVLVRTRATCVESYLHDIPFVHILAEAPDLMDPLDSQDHAPGVFQVFPFPFALDGQLVGDLRIFELRRRLISQPVGCDVPDGILWTLNPHSDGDLIGHLQFRRNRFDQSTISTAEAEFSRLLRDAVTAPDAPLALA